jgi:hypothetical protein
VTLEEIVAYLKDLGIATFKLPERLEIRASCRATRSARSSSANCGTNCGLEPARR